VLLAFVLGVDRVWVLTNSYEDLQPPDRKEFVRLVKRRASGYPLQYITGTKEFMSFEFFVPEGVLIPRSDTELLIEAVVEAGMQFKHILDIGTGTGAIAVTLAKLLPGTCVTALDISRKAVETARENARRRGVGGRVKVLHADLFTWKTDNSFDAVVSNPPYIPSRDLPLLQKEVKFEPRQALDGGLDGLKFYHRLTLVALHCLVTGGLFAVETGDGQAEAVSGIITARGGFKGIEILRDYGGRQRVVRCFRDKGGCDDGRTNRQS